MRYKFWYFYLLERERSKESKEWESSNNLLLMLLRAYKMKEGFQENKEIPFQFLLLNQDDEYAIVVLDSQGIFQGQLKIKIYGQQWVNIHLPKI